MGNVVEAGGGGILVRYYALHLLYHIYVMGILLKMIFIFN